MALDADVLIVGGGPAGLAAAIACRARGFRVLAVDGGKPPITKACGEGLLPDAVAALGELGVVLREADGFALRGIRFEDAGRSVSACFPGRNGIGVRRETLHERMIERARDCGASLMWNTPVTGLREEGVVAGANKIRARWVIGADGSRSRVRRWSGMESFRLPASRFAVRRHYRVEPWTDFTEVHWGKAVQAYVTPVSAQEICVVQISNEPNSRFDGNLGGFCKLIDRLRGAEQASTERGAVTSMFELKHVVRGNVALIGDASGSVDAITGEGLSLSFRQAIVLAGALATGDLKRYQEAHRRLFQRPRHVGNLLLFLGRQDALRKRTVRALEAAPRLFERMLAYHLGDTRPLQLAASGAHFGWRFLTA
ncbi:MAG: NAD(P)/FAD-dependent oxidoreductase [Candidatus Acidiferrum sp.]